MIIPSKEPITIDRIAILQLFLPYSFLLHFSMRFQVVTLKSSFVSSVGRRGHFIAQRGHYLTPSTKSAPLWLRLRYNFAMSVRYQNHQNRICLLMGGNSESERENEGMARFRLRTTDLMYQWLNQSTTAITVVAGNKVSWHHIMGAVS